MMADPGRACAATTLPAMLPRLALVSLALTTLSLAGCGRSDDDALGGPERAPSTGPTTAPSAEAAAQTAPAAQAAPAGELPDPCSLLDTEQLTDLLGADPGEGTVAGPARAQRRTCTFEAGVVLAVEVATGWDATLARLRSQAGGDVLEPAPGIGREAYWQERGRQVVALGEHYLVGVAGADQAAGKAVAEGMLAAL